MASAYEAEQTRIYIMRVIHDQRLNAKVDNKDMIYIHVAPISVSNRVWAYLTKLDTDAYGDVRGRLTRHVFNYVENGTRAPLLTVKEHAQADLLKKFMAYLVKLPRTHWRCTNSLSTESWQLPMGITTLLNCPQFTVKEYEGLLK